jgi:hypothetical protein
MTWINTVAVLQQHFGGTNIDMVNTMVINQQQPNESLQSYASKVKKAVNKMYPNNRGFNGNDRELKMLQHFINGILSTTLKNQLKATTKTFNDTVQMAIHLEQQQHGQTLNNNK